MTTIETNSAGAVDNGVDVAALLGAREALTGAPELAQFQWRAESEWVDGTHSRTTIEKFGGLGGEQSHKRAFILDTDHPEIFAALSPSLPRYDSNCPMRLSQFLNSSCQAWSEENKLERSHVSSAGTSARAGSFLGAFIRRSFDFREDG